MHSFRLNYVNSIDQPQNRYDMKTKLVLLLVLGLSLGFTSFAQPGRGPFQRKGMAYGMRSGAITPGEAIHLRNMKRDIRCDVRQARRNDGVIGPMERRHLKREVRQYKRHRFMATHNNRSRF
jgi:hypothetical protein